MLRPDRKICIVGTGGFAREVLCCLADVLSILGKQVTEASCFMETDEHYRETEIMGVPVIRESDFDPALYQVLVAIADPSVRKRVVAQLPETTQYASIVHPSAVLSDHITLGEGSIVCAGTILTCNISIGKHAQLNLHTSIGHDCRIGDFFTTAPGARISGNCAVGDCVYFGTNAAARQGLRICDDVTVGMGTMVLNDISRQGVYVGNPLRQLLK